MDIAAAFYLRGLQYDFANNGNEVIDALKLRKFVPGINGYTDAGNELASATKIIKMN